MDRKLILDFDKREKSRKHKHSAKRSSPNKKHKHEPDDQEQSTSYRDRAQERREGINKDFELDPDDLVISNPVADGEQYVDEAERRRQQIDESKYLGGDVEHTHLVKGLDFALMEKIKAEDKKEAERLNQHDKGFSLPGACDSDDEEFTKEALLATNATTSTKRQIDLGKLKASQMIPCKTAIARRILNVLDEEWPKRSELFLPGRMSYILPIDEDSDASVTTIVRSRVEQQDSEQSNENDLAFDKLIDIFSKLRKRTS